MKKQVLYICIFMSFLLLTACSFNKISSSSEYEVEQQKIEEIRILPNEIQDFDEQEEKTEKISNLEEDEWIESIEEQNAGKCKSNGKIEISIVRTSKPVISETGEILANAYYDRPVVSGDSEVAKKINQFFEQEERSWLEGDAGRLTGYYKDYYLSFCENVKSMCEQYGEEEVAKYPLRYAIDSRIVFLSDSLLSILQIENYFGGHCNWHYYGSTFDLKTGELTPIDALVDITPSKMKEIVGDAGEMYDVLEDENYVIDYNGYTIAMNYEYYYDGNHYFIIVNRGNDPKVIRADGEIREWNGEWGDLYEIIIFQYTVDMQNERWRKILY